MSHIRGKNTRPELIVRKYLFAHGFRFRVNVKKLPGTPDIVLRKYHTVIFVNGCFWHGHEGCPYFVLPKSNVEFWNNKITRNRERDLKNRIKLRDMMARHPIVGMPTETQSPGTKPGRTGLYTKQNDAVELSGEVIRYCPGNQQKFTGCGRRNNGLFYQDLAESKTTCSASLFGVKLSLFHREASSFTTTHYLSTFCIRMKA